MSYCDNYDNIGYKIVPTYIAPNLITSFVTQKFYIHLINFKLYVIFKIKTVVEVMLVISK